jgi:general secretion pathway protein K
MQKRTGSKHIRWLFRDDRGVALIITIMAISIIVALSVQFRRKMGDQLTSAVNIDHGLKALYMAKSGIAYALAILDEDQRRVDTLQDTWSVDSETLKQVSADSAKLFSSGAFELKIEDLSSKIQINQLVDNEDLSKVFKKFLNIEAFGLDESDVINEIVDSTKDWIDFSGEDDDLTRAFGAENDHYQSLDNPYYCKNAPFDSLEELLLVKGMTPEIFGTQDDDSKISHYLAVFGDGKININTADAKVLQSLHEDMTQGMAEEMDVYRKDAPDDTVLEDKNWYHDSGAGVPEDIKFPDAIVTTKSTHFQITSTGRFGIASNAKENHKDTVSRTIVAVVHRPGPDEEGDREGFRVISWKIE